MSAKGHQQVPSGWLSPLCHLSSVALVLLATSEAGLVGRHGGLLNPRAFSHALLLRIVLASPPGLPSPPPVLLVLSCALKVAGHSPLVLNFTSLYPHFPSWSGGYLGWKGTNVNLSVCRVG